MKLLALRSLSRHFPGRRARRALADDCGAAVVEFAILLPVLILLLAGIIQFGAVMYSRQMMLYAAREAARSYAVGMNDANQARQLALNLLSDAPGNYDAVVSGPLGGAGGAGGAGGGGGSGGGGGGSGGGAGVGVTQDIVVRITVPMDEASIINVIGGLMTGDLEVEVTMYVEGGAGVGGGGGGGGSGVGGGGAGGGSGGGVVFNDYLTGGVSVAA